MSKTNAEKKHLIAKIHSLVSRQNGNESCVRGREREHSSQSNGCKPLISSLQTLFILTPLFFQCDLSLYRSSSILRQCFFLPLKCDKVKHIFFLPLIALGIGKNQCRIKQNEKKKNLEIIAFEHEGWLLSRVAGFSSCLFDPKSHSNGPYCSIDIIFLVHVSSIFCTINNNIGFFQTHFFSASNRSPRSLSSLSFFFLFDANRFIKCVRQQPIALTVFIQINIRFFYLIFFSMYISIFLLYHWILSTTVGQKERKSEWNEQIRSDTRESGKKKKTIEGKKM